MTASAPCSIVSLILSCFSSLREICSDTHTLLGGLELVIVAQDSGRRRRLGREAVCTPVWIYQCARGLGDVRHRTAEGANLEYADSVHSLRRGACAERRAVWRAFESAVQVLEMRES